jgi:hypothetical protein
VEMVGQSQGLMFASYLPGSVLASLSLLGFPGDPLTSITHSHFSYGNGEGATAETYSLL